MTEETIRRLAAETSVCGVMAVGYYATLIALLISFLWNGLKMIKEKRIYRNMKEEDAE